MLVKPCGSFITEVTYWQTMFIQLSSGGGINHYFPGEVDMLGQFIAAPWGWWLIQGEKMWNKLVPLLRASIH